MITLDHVAFGYEGRTIVQDISLELRPGEVTCLLGASGCGKTTLLKLIAGLVQPVAGAIHTDIARPSRHIGFMPQSGALLPWRNVFENIALGFELTGQEIDASRIETVLAQVGLADKAHAMPSALSGGQQQRVALARQLVLNPKILLLDEPLGALDVVLRQELAQLIRMRVKQDGIAAFVVTHQPDDALFLADHLFILAGSPAHLTHQWQMGKDIDAETGFADLVGALREVSHA